MEQRPIVLLQKARQAQVKTVDTPRTAKLDRNVLSFAGCGDSDDDSESDDSGDKRGAFSLKRTVLARPKVQGSEGSAKSPEPQQMPKQPEGVSSAPQEQQQQQQQQQQRKSDSPQPTEPVEKVPDDASKVEKEPKRRKRSAEEEEKLLARMERFRSALRASMSDSKESTGGEDSAAVDNAWMCHTLVFKKVTAAEDDMVREDGEYVTYDPRMHKHVEQNSQSTPEEKENAHPVERRSRSHSRSHHSHHSRHHHHHHNHRSDSHSRRH